MKTHANLVYSCSIQLGGVGGLTLKFGGVKKRCENAQERCEIVDIKEFSYENPRKPFTFL